MKKKRIKTILVFLLIVVITCAIVTCEILYHYNYKYTFKLKEDKITVSINTKLDPLNYVEALKNVNVYYDNVDTSKVGTYKIKYIVRTKFNRKHIYYLEVNVIDNRVYEEPEKVEVKKEEPVKEKEVVNTTSNTGKTSKGYTIEVRDSVTYVNGILIANKTYSLPSTYNPGGLTSETTKAANEMFAAAAAVGFNMWAQSGFRSYSTQQKLYNRYAARDGKAKADTYSARPGHSEHQTGLAFDVCAKGKPCINSNFNNTEEAKWLSMNAHLYGFILRYPQGKTNETGYLYESWHFRYVGKELASILYNDGDWITLENYLGITSEYKD